MPGLSFPWNTRMKSQPTSLTNDVDSTTKKQSHFQKATLLKRGQGDETEQVERAYHQNRISLNACYAEMVQYPLADK